VPVAPPTPPPSPTGQQPVPVPAGTPEAEKFFAENVYPSIFATCSSCHSGGANVAPQWLGDNASAAYDLIKSYKNGVLAAPIDSNLLLLKEAHQGGQQLNADQKGLVQQWLVIEYENQNPSAPSQSFSQALENFANCMNFGDWQARGLDQDLPLQPVSVNAAEVAFANCETCHLDADLAGGVLLNSADAAATFDNFQIFPAIVKLATASGFPFVGLVAANRLIDKGKEYNSCVVDNALLDLVANNDLNNPFYCHPNFDFAEAVEDDLEFFVTNTIAIAKVNNCANQGQ